MVKTLVLVRHGDPEKTSVSGTDLDRTLTAAGAHALEVAYPRVFALLGEDADVAVWSSPAMRALQTAEVVADVLGAEGIEVKDSLYAQDQAAFLAELSATEATAVVAVGHVPFMDQLTARLTGIELSFSKGAAAAIDLPNGPGNPGALRWYVAGPELSAWQELASVEQAVAGAAAELLSLYKAFVNAPDDPEALRTFRIALRRVRSLLQFLEPWQAKKQNRRAIHLIRSLQVASARLRDLDILSAAVDALVEDGELGENSLLPMACAKERQLECSSFTTYMHKHGAAKDLKHMAKELSSVSWKSKVVEKGVTADDFCKHFDEQLTEVDDDLFGLDLRDGNAVYEARRDAKEMHYVAERLGGVLGPERAVMSEYMDEIQTELGALSDARRNKKIADECSKSPRFRGVRADLGVVARDQAEVISAITSGLERMEREDDAPDEPEVAAEPVEPTPEPETEPEPAPETVS